MWLKIWIVIAFRESYLIYASSNSTFISPAPFLWNSEHLCKWRRTECSFRMQAWMFSGDEWNGNWAFSKLLINYWVRCLKDFLEETSGYKICHERFIQIPSANDKSFYCRGTLPHIIFHPFQVESLHDRLSHSPRPHIRQGKRGPWSTKNKSKWPLKPVFKFCCT